MGTYSAGERRGQRAAKLATEIDMPLSAGDSAPDFTLLAAHKGEVKKTSLTELLGGQKALVLATYALDFTGG
jgi:peroxiredoxin